MQTSDRRTRLLAWVIAAPAIVAAAGLPAVEAYRVVNPSAPLFGDPPAASIVEAIERGNQGVEEAYRFIVAGQDPNRQVLVNDANLTGGHPVMVSPLMLAVAARNRNVVQMLMSFGARLDVPQNSQALCLAKALQNDAIVATLEGSVGEEPPCSKKLDTYPFPLIAAVE
jgi:hypothetical protein